MENNEIPAGLDNGATYHLYDGGQYIGKTMDQAYAMRWTEAVIGRHLSAIAAGKTWSRVVKYDRKGWILGPL